MKRLNQNYERLWDFMSWDYFAFSISICLVILSAIFIGTKGFNLGLNFTGGAVIEITLEKPISINNIRESLQKKISHKKILLQNFENNCGIIIRIPLLANANDLQTTSKKTIEMIEETTSQRIELKRAEFIGPSAGANLEKTSVVALLVSLISIFIYTWLRFEWHLATGIVISLLHDIIITAGFLSLFKVEIDLTIIASLISIISYSLNDSIVVSDRIRENFQKMKKKSSREIFNISLSQIFHRTLISSGTILTAVLILYVFGGSILEGFSLTMFIGMIAGTASSIYVASSIALRLGIKHEHLLQKSIK